MQRKSSVSRDTGCSKAFASEAAKRAAPSSQETRLACDTATVSLFAQTEGTHDAAAPAVPDNSCSGSMRRLLGVHAPAAWGPCAGCLGSMRRLLGVHAPAAWGPCAGCLRSVRQLLGIHALDAWGPCASCSRAARGSYVGCALLACWLRAALVERFGTAACMPASQQCCQLAGLHEHETERKVVTCQPLTPSRTFVTLYPKLKLSKLSRAGLLPDV